MKNLIFSLCKKNGVSGSETEIAKYCCNYLSEFSSAVIDNRGNVIASFGNKNSGNNLLLDAHMDQIGLIVTFIDENGFIKASPCGGIDRRILLGVTYTILGKRHITAVPCTLPPHLIKEENKALEQDNIWFDTGLSKDEILSNISLGDRIIFSSQPCELINNRILSPALDNRAGVAAVLSCAKKLSKLNLNTEITVVLSTQEETNFSGAKTGTFTASPTEAVVVDVSFARFPGIPSDKCGVMGLGPMIGISPILEKDYSRLLIETAKNNNIPYQLEVMGGTTGTNADVITINKSGVPTALVSIPLKNMHTNAEIIDLMDVENTANLIYSYIASKYSI